jgi:hypothetical protein
MQTLEKTTAEGQNIGNTHPTYCPSLGKQCSSGGVAECIGIIDEAGAMPHPEYTNCSIYQTLNSAGNRK